MHQHIDSVLHGARAGHRGAVDEENFISVFDGIEAMGDDDLGRSGRKLIKDRVEKLFGHGVDIGGCLVKDK